VISIQSALHFPFGVDAPEDSIEVPWIVITAVYSRGGQARRDKPMFFGILLEAISVVHSSAKPPWYFQISLSRFNQSREKKFKSPIFRILPEFGESFHIE